MPARPPFTPIAPAIIAAARRLYEAGAAAADIAAELKMSVTTVMRRATDEGWKRKPAKSAPPKKIEVVKAPKRAASAIATKNRKAKAKPMSRRVTRAAAPPAMIAPASQAAELDPAARRAVLISRLHRAVERQVEEVEKRLGASDDLSSERDARALAVLVRLVREIATLESAAPLQQPGAAAEEDYDVEAAVADYRERLARMFESLSGERNDAADDGADSGSAPGAGTDDDLELSGTA